MMAREDDVAVLSVIFQLVSSTVDEKYPPGFPLSNYTHWMSVHSGVKIEFIEHFKTMLDNDVSSSELQFCANSMDEMKIKSGLVFSRASGHLVGLCGVNVFTAVHTYTIGRVLMERV